MPATTQILFETPVEMLTFKAEDPSQIAGSVKGANAIVEDTVENIIKWLKPFDGIWVGNGVPQLEQFTVMHIKDENDEKETP